MNGKKALWILPILLWSAVGSADPSRQEPCGTGANATLEERIKECEGGLMRLVMVDDAGHEIMMDDKGLLWGPKLEGTYSFEEAKTVCRNVTPAQGYPTIPGVGKWRVPEPKELARIGQKLQSYFNQNCGAYDCLNPDVQGDGSWKELADMDEKYWSSSLERGKVGWVVNRLKWFHVPPFVFDGNTGRVYARSDDSSVRCVAR